MEIVTYTGVFGGYDSLRPARWHNARCYCDGLLKPVEGWEYYTIFVGRPPKWANRHVKILAHEHLNTEYSIYHDGNIKMLVSPTDAVERWLGDADMAVFAHPERDCVYKEAEAVINLRKSPPAPVVAQMERYRAEGMPERFGLSACWVLVRRHTEAVREFCELWWKEYEQGAKRDQLSFDYVRWKTGMQVATIPGNLFQGTSPDFDREPHRRAELQQANWRTAYGKMLLPGERQYLVDAARDVAVNSSHPIIVNIGIFRFASMLCLRAGAPDAELVGVDIKAPDGDAPGLNAARLIIGDSKVVHRDFDKPIHLLFIDGDHRYATVKADLRNWASKKVVPGGVVILHDYAPQPKHLALLPELEGVRRATMEWHRKMGWEKLPAPDSLAAFRRPM